MLAEPGIRYKTIVFDGTPMYENARLLYRVMRFGFLKKHRKAKRMPVEEMEKRMEEKYGVFGSAMAERFPGGMVTFDAVNAMGLKVLDGILNGVATAQSPQIKISL